MRNGIHLRLPVPLDVKSKRTLPKIEQTAGVEAVKPNSRKQGNRWDIPKCNAEVFAVFPAHRNTSNQSMYASRK